jgi:predicted  nucleic acid-binding Zn-ribbon protein
MLHLCLACGSVSYRRRIPSSCPRCDGTRIEHLRYDKADARRLPRNRTRRHKRARF